MKRFLTSTRVGPIQHWHPFAALAALCALGGAFLLGALIVWGVWALRPSVATTESASTAVKPAAGIIRPAPEQPAKTPQGQPSKAPQGMTVKQFKTAKPKEPTLVRGLVQLNQIVPGGPDQHDMMTIYVLNPDKSDAVMCELFLNSADGRRLHHLLRDGSAKPMTVRLEGFLSTPYGGDIASFAGIVSEN